MLSLVNRNWSVGVNVGECLETQKETMRGRCLEGGYQHKNRMQTMHGEEEDHQEVSKE